MPSKYHSIIKIVCKIFTLQLNEVSFFLCFCVFVISSHPNHKESGEIARGEDALE